ncbi:MAG: helix-turn-helix transcriptional regulator [Eubacteriales bacterium]|nr:helix-turn-helix transcriptional regulator [Eubacteriales bacterium]NLO16152.1 helix-turn-helix transcriptional regulator [Clostridiales bacterium]
MKLQDKILYCRKKAGLSQEQLAERIGVSRQAISKWETGDAVPEIS